MIQPLAQGSRQHYTVPILVLDISLKLFFNFLFIDFHVYIPFSNFDIYWNIIYLFIYKNSHLNLWLMTALGQKGQITVPLIFMNKNQLVTLKSHETFCINVLLVHLECCSSVQMLWEICHQCTSLQHLHYHYVIAYDSHCCNRTTFQKKRGKWRQQVKINI